MTTINRHTDSIWQQKTFGVMILLGVIFMVLPIASATMSFSNYDEYFEAPAPYGTIDVWDGNWLFQDVKMATYTLTDNTDLCIINCEAKGIAILYYEGRLFEDVRFETLQKKATSIESSQFYISTKTESYYEDIPDFRQVCETITNGTSCHQEQYGTHQEERIRDIWKEYNGEILTAGNYKWKLEGKKSQEQSVDWIAKSNNVELTQWATWTSSLNVGLKAYYEMSNATETTSGFANITGGTMSYAPTGIIGKSANYSLSNTDYVGDNSFAELEFFNNANDNITSLNFWVKVESLTNSIQPSFLNKYNGGGTGWLLAQGYTDASTLDLGYFSASETDWITAPNTLKTNAWTMITIVANKTGINLYINGTFIESKGRRYVSLIATTNNMKIGKYGAEVSKGLIDEMGWWNRTLSTSEVSDLYNGGAGITYVVTEASTPLSITTTLISPANNTNYSITSATFSANATAVNGNVTNMTLYIWNGGQTTNVTTGFSGTFNSTSWIQSGLTEGVNIWNVLSCGTNSTGSACAYNTNRTFTIDTTPPIVTIIAPNSSYIVQNPLENITLNYSATDTNIGSCWYNTTYNATATALNCATNSSLLYPSTNPATLTIYVYANDTVGNTNYSSVTITKDTTPPIINITYPINGGVYYSKNITLNYTRTDTNLANCSYSLNNGTNVVIAGCVNTTINLVARNNSLVMYANDTFGNNANSTTIYPYYLPQLGLCNTTNTMNYINFTFKNETVGTESISASFISSWDYYFDTGITKSFSFTNNTVNPSYAFCIDGSNQTMYATPSVQYANADAYSRNYYENLTLTNTTTNKVLYLLPIGDGQYVTFTVVDSLSQTIGQALVDIKLPVGSYISSKLTDDLGVATLYLNPLTQYVISGSKTGFTTSTKTYAPVLTAYTITLGGVQVTNATDVPPVMNGILEGITIDINPKQSQLENDTTYNFNCTFTAADNNLDEFGYTLSNLTDVLDSDSKSTSSGGFVDSVWNTGSNTQLIFDCYFVVDGTYGNITKYYYVYDSSGDGWSIKNFGRDLVSYADDGIFGLTNFGLSLIIFLIIFGVTGIMAYKYSFSSPAMIVTIIFLQVLFFDFALGLIPNPIGAIPHFPTFFIGLILAGLFFREVSSG